MAFRGIPTFEERYAEHIRPEALALVRREAPITLAEYEAGRWNSYEWHLILRRLDDDAFAVYADHNIKESRPAETRDGIFTTYTEALIGHVAPELLRRWKALRETRVRAISAIQCAVEGALKLDAEVRAAVIFVDEHDVEGTPPDGQEALEERNEAFDRLRRIGQILGLKGRNNEGEIEVDRTTSPPDTLTLSRAEAEALREVMDPTILRYTAEQEAAVRKVDAFLSGKEA